MVLEDFLESLQLSLADTSRVLKLFKDSHYIHPNNLIFKRFVLAVLLLLADFSDPSWKL